MGFRVFVAHATSNKREPNLTNGMRREVGGGDPSEGISRVDAVSGPEHNTNVILETKLLQPRHGTSRPR